jgi:hypothetical protein
MKILKGEKGLEWQKKAEEVERKELPTSIGQFDSKKFLLDLETDNRWFFGTQGGK